MSAGLRNTPEPHCPHDFHILCEINLVIPVETLPMAAEREYAPGLVILRAKAAISG
eukprot:CAMPEP_0174725306 /NCGR_PEP_ID=MMETSP1094-20130205/45249_1 /TAXON_ID=156173 /ORGANISM="Chrysochromulina brevifilum, Strain UTEX LB 985" /LENGTH=55 /DNA_ID=CAMNT_0015926677 /DNA_START=79 /DNA_END=246 /DNA_ORIENTATION=-